MPAARPLPTLWEKRQPASTRLSTPSRVPFPENVPMRGHGRFHEGRYTVSDLPNGDCTRQSTSKGLFLWSHTGMIPGGIWHDPSETTTPPSPIIRVVRRQSFPRPSLRDKFVLDRAYPPRKYDKTTPSASLSHYLTYWQDDPAFPLSRKNSSY